MKYREQTKKILIVLSLVLCFMTVGYAAFYSKLDITGTSSITNTWDVEITSVTVGTITGKGENVKTPTWNALTASMEANVYKSGDSVSYNVTISNLGSLDAKLEEITKNITVNNSAVKIELSNYTQGEVLYKNGQSGSTKNIIVTISYNDEYTGEHDYNTSTQTNVTFNYVQADGNIDPSSNKYEVTFNANGGTVSPETQEVIKGDAIGQLPIPIKDNFNFGGWYTKDEEEVDETYIPEDDTQLFAKWFEPDIVAVMDGTGYTSLSSAINKVSANNTKKTIKLLKSIKEYNTIAANKNITINLNGYNINQSSSNKIFTNNGTLELLNGSLSMTGTTNVIANNNIMEINNCSITSSAASGAVDNNADGNLKIINTRIEMTGARQAVYNNGGILKISGTSYLSNVKDRAALHNLNDGTVTIEAGTIISTSTIGAVYNEAGTITIGKKDDIISVENPVIQGKTYAINATGNINFYDGILKGVTSVLNNPSQTVIETIEKNSKLITDQENINGTTYQTLYLGQIGETFTVTLDAGEGEVSPSSIQVEVENEIGQLPTPTRDLYNFIGWYTKENDGIEVTSTYVPEEDITIYARWEKKPTYIITFSSDDGSNIEDKEIERGKAIGDLPTLTRSGYIFDGWYLEDSYQTKATESYIPTKNQTLYAKWLKGEFSKVFEQTGECTFHGGTSNITGSQCQKYADKKYIDTGISLYSEENINKDYEVGFEIVEFVPSDNVNQATLFNTKLESTGYPGLVFRKNGSTNLEIASRKTSSNNESFVLPASNVRTFTIYRINKEIYYSVNGGEKVLLNDLTQYNPTFNTTAWFGATPTTAAATTAQRYIVGTLKNMYIKLGTYEQTDITNLEVTTTKTASSITVIANTTTTSEITKYEFSKNDGETWINNGTNNTYQFTNLNNNTSYPIKVRVTSTNGNIETKSIDVTTFPIELPTYSNNAGTVTITYPPGCGSTYTCTYIKDDTNPVTVTSLTETVTFTNSGTLVAIVSDGTNEVSSSFTVE